MFQSLLWWIGRVNSSGSVEHVNPVDVSILVVVDWSRQRQLSDAMEPDAIMFQSLLWWIGRVNASRPPRVRPRAVSILVVVDWSRQRPRPSRRWGPIGVSILVVVDWSRQRPPEQQYGSEPSMFQSLLWWIGRVNKTAFYPAMRRVPQFQSLLWWIGRVNRELLPCRTQRVSFNPCCGGLVASTNISGSKPEDESVFQSLLWWIGRVNLASDPKEPTR